MPILYESTDNLMKRRGTILKLSPSPGLKEYLIVFGVGAVVGGILVYGPTRGALISAVAKGARVPAEKVEAWAKT